MGAFTLQLEALQLPKVVGDEEFILQLPGNTSLTLTRSPSGPGKQLKRYRHYKEEKSMGLVLQSTFLCEPLSHLFAVFRNSRISSTTISVPRHQ